MGNAGSLILAREPDWDAYLTAEWRSDTARELDSLGGLCRAPIPRGGSFSARLALLETVLNKHGTELQKFFQPQQADPNAKKGRRGAKLPIPELLALRQGPIEVAEWRQRMHAARRRVILVVKCTVLMMRGKLKVAPVPRLDRFDFAIYSTLGGDWIKVAEEQQRYMTLRDQVEAATVALQDAIQAATAPPEPVRTNSRSLPPLAVGGGGAGSPQGSPTSSANQLPFLTVDGLPGDPQPPASPKPPSGPGRPLVHSTVVGSGGGGGAARLVAPGGSPGSSGGGGSGQEASTPTGGGGRNHGVAGVRSNLGSQAAMHAGRANKDKDKDSGTLPTAASAPPGALPPARAANSGPNPAASAPGAGPPAPPRRGSLSGYASSPNVPALDDASCPPLESRNTTLGFAKPPPLDLSLSMGGGASSANGMVPMPPPLLTPSGGATTPGKKPSGLFIRARIRQAGEAQSTGGTPPAPTTPTHGSGGGGGSSGPNSGGGPGTSSPALGPGRLSLFGGEESRGFVPEGGSRGFVPEGGSRGFVPEGGSRGFVPEGSSGSSMPPAPGSTQAFLPSLPDSPSMQRARAAQQPPWADGDAAGGGGGGSGPWPGAAAVPGLLPKLAGRSFHQHSSSGAAVPGLRADTSRLSLLREEGLDGSRGVSGARGSYSLDGRPRAGLDGDLMGEEAGSSSGTGPGAPSGGRLSKPGGPSSVSRKSLVAAAAGTAEQRRSSGGGGVRRASHDGVSGSGGAGTAGVAAAGASTVSVNGMLHATTGGGIKPPLVRASSDAGRAFGGRASEPVIGASPARRPPERTPSGLSRQAFDGPASSQLPRGSNLANAATASGAAVSPVYASPSANPRAVNVRAAAAADVAAACTSPVAASGSGRGGSGTGYQYTGPGSNMASPVGPRPPMGAPISSQAFKTMSVLRQAAAVRVSGSGVDPGAAAGGAASSAGSPAQQQQVLIVSPEASAKIEQLKAQLTARIEDLHRCSQLISVFLNRCNAAWAEAQSWGPPPMVSQLQLSAFARSESAMVFRNELVRMLCTGGLAVHLRAADDYLEPGLARSWGQSVAADQPAGSGLVSPGSIANATIAAMTGPGGANASAQSLVQQGLERLGSGRWPGTAGGGFGGGTSSGSVNGSAFNGAAPLAGGFLPGLMYRSTAPDLWTHDPWKMLDQHRPGMTFSGPRLDAIPLGCRVLASLVLAVEALAGRDAIAHLPLVLAVSEDQQDEVVRQLWGFRFFGIPRDNVVIVVQPSHPGYWYDPAHRMWNQGDASHSLPLGSGYGLMQLAWGGEAMRVNEDGCLAPLSISALAWMEARGVKWMVSRRARDLSLLSKDGVLDMTSLAYGLYYHTDRAPNTNVIMEAQPAANLLLSRALDSIVLARRPEGVDTETSAGAAVALPSPGSGGGASSGSGQQQVVELSHSDLATPVMRAVLADCQAAGRVLAGVGRYMMHLASIKSMLAGRLSVLRPKLGLVDDMLHLRLEAADVTSASTASTLLMQAKPDLPQLLVHDDVEALLPLLQAQDNNTAFRQLVMSCRDDDMRAAAVSTPPPNGAAVERMRLHPHSQRIVVFVVSNNVSAAAVSMAASLARPGRDVVTLATVVPDAKLFKDRSEQLLSKHALAFEKQCVAHYSCEVVERGSYGLIDCMENFCVVHGATLVIMGSNSLTSAASTSSSSSTAGSGSTAASLIHIVGSVTLALMRRMPMPLILVTRASHAASAAAVAAAEKEGRRRPLRLLAVLEGQAKGMVEYLAGKLCNTTGGDQLVLSYIRPSANLTRQQQANVKALIGRYLHQVAGQGMRPATTLILDAPMDRSLAAAVQEHTADLLCLPAGPRNAQVPPGVVATLRAASCAVMWHRDAGASSLGA
ncbi:hypothetical protein HYH03_009654 [Edaphochlamys debaryana]|uniref:Uncharacterized protein n=1 Tax=Edaphochlamys debaryana TaxID=47281 RepID=A0A836BYC5_9CHLO|nr:hypothetical protein HYH03_009654 [Edaphochlamys debaryana]|eukprot:KAG2492163.1 hypothetical protein HYH03_009654 [Edaphochlamys debaryana]